MPKIRCQVCRRSKFVRSNLTKYCSPECKERGKRSTWLKRDAREFAREVAKELAKLLRVPASNQGSDRITAELDRVREEAEEHGDEPAFNVREFLDELAPPSRTRRIDWDKVKD